jgi:hypothetical protein
MDKRLKLESGILSVIMSKGVESTKADILGENPMEDKVYTKRINICKDFGTPADAVEIVSVCITNDRQFSMMNPPHFDDVRINTKNHRGQWCNIFIKEAPEDMLEFIWNEIA